MAKIPVVLLFAALQLHALNNSVRVYNTGTGDLTDGPIQVSRIFAQGEFAAGSYPKPFLDGAGAAAWQVDVKTTWPDGSVQHAIISTRGTIPNGGSVQIDFRSAARRCHADTAGECEAGLDEAGVRNFLAGAWNGQVRGTLNSIEYSADVKTILSSGAYRYWLKGPVVTQLIAEDRTTALAFDFGWEYNGTAWVAPTNDKFKSIHPVFDVAVWPGVGTFADWPGVWVQSRLYNGSTSRMQKLPLERLEFLTGGTPAVAYSVCSSGCTVTAAPTIRAAAAFRWDGWSGAAPQATVTDFNLPYMIHTRVLPQYDLSQTIATTYADATLSFYNLKSGPTPQLCSDTVYCANILKAMTTTGGRGDIGLMPKWNLDYLMLMGTAAAPALKLEVFQKLVLGNADAMAGQPIHNIDTELSTSRDDPSDGQRYYFHYPANQVTRAFGRFISINSRINYSTAAGCLSPDCMPASVCPTSAVCGTSDANNWILDNSHWPNHSAIPYVLTGNPWHLLEQQFAAAKHLYSPNYGRSEPWQRFREWGLRMPGSGSLRGRAWGLREIFWGALLTPDGEPEKAYFLEKLKNNDEYFEGFYRITDKNYARDPASCGTFAAYTNSSAASPWCVGYYGLGYNGYQTWDNPLSIVGEGIDSTAYGTWYNGVNRLLSYFMLWYHSIVQNWIHEMDAFRANGGSLWRGNRVHDANFLAGMIFGGGNPFGTAQYLGPLGIYPTRRVNTWSEFNTAMQAVSSLASPIDASTLTIPLSNGFNRETKPAYLMIGTEIMQVCTYAVGQTTAGICAGGRGAWGSVAQAHSAGEAVRYYQLYSLSGSADYTGGYGVLFRAASSFLTDIPRVTTYGSGQRLYDFMVSNLPSQQGVNTNMHWRFVPRERIRGVIAKSPAAGELELTYLAPGGEPCKVQTGTAMPEHSDDAGAPLDGGGLRVRRWTKSGLGSGAVHYRITCGTARSSGTATVL
jgi:hypothetical protein